MAQIRDSRGNEFTGSIDRISGEVINDLRDPVGLIAVLNGEVIVDLNGSGTVIVDVRGTFVAQMTYEASVDGVNYVSLGAFNVLTQQYITTLTSSGAGPHAVNVAGFRRFRVRAIAFTSGALAVAIRSSVSEYSMLNVPLSASLSVTTTAAVGVAAALTLPSGGTGLFHYITRLAVERFFSLVGAALATPTIVTTTNMPGTRALSFPTAGAVGTMYEKILEPTQPLKSSVANAATTVSCPAVADTIWRITADYYLGT